ncbi:heat shock protein 30 [Xylariomycetidae sp. FL0641]|nr:heat shock protein 30 [Xylariomycetidae sp. FL0641]
MGILLNRNQAFQSNPPAGSDELSVNGSDWLWTVTAIYCVSFLAFFALSFMARAGEKIFHYMFTIALLVGTICYYAMASDLGFLVIKQADDSPDYTHTRQIFYAKYINWVVSFPVITMALGLLSGVSWATIFYNVFLCWTWIISYLISSFTVSDYKWGFYAWGTFAWMLLAFNTLGEGSTSAKRVGVGRDHMMLSGWLNLLWLLYPIAFGLSDGSNYIGVTPGFIFFGILDVFMIPMMSFAFLFLARRWDYGALNIAFTRYGRVHHTGTFPEKAAATPATAPATAAAVNEPAVATA